MALTLQVGTEVFQYPENGTNPQEQWGEEASNWAKAVTDLLANIQGPDDISITTFSLADNVTSPTDIVGLIFSTTNVISVNVEYVIERIIPGPTVIAESGIIMGYFDGTNFAISQQAVGNSGISIDVQNDGQFVYTSTNLSHTSCTIKFKGTAIGN